VGEMPRHGLDLEESLYDVYICKSALSACALWETIKSYADSINFISFAGDAQQKMEFQALVTDSRGPATPRVLESLLDFLNCV